MHQTTRSRNSALVWVFAALSLSGGLPSTAWAGSETPLGTDVFVYPNGRRASGIIAMARKSADSTQKIGCFLSSSAVSSYLSCQATDKNGVSASCSKTSPSAFELNAVGGITADSFIEFEGDLNGKCTYLFVHKISDTGSGQL